MPDESSRQRIELSVILCAHNPRKDYLDRVIEALRRQSLEWTRWELVAVDNASNLPLREWVALDWHPRGRLVLEETLGLTAARLRGVVESSGALLVFVDDDNVLAEDYLEVVLRIAQAHPRAGSWGGNVRLVFDVPPPTWTQKYWDFLAQRVVLQDKLVCNSTLTMPMPVGAGLCVRREVVEQYAHEMAMSPWRRKLDRTGVNLSSGGDNDMCLTGCKMGFERGLFRDLRLDHLIPEERLREQYLLNLVEAVQFSSYVLEMARDSGQAPPPVNWWWWTKYAADCATKSRRKRRFYMACKRANRQARRLYEEALEEGLIQRSAGAS